MDQDIVPLLRQALGDSAVLDDKRSREFHSADALNPARAYHSPASSWTLPSVVVTPRSTDQVMQTVRLARQHRTPIIPFGGGTGVMGAAVPEQGGIVLDLKHMNAVRSLSHEDRVVLVEAGSFSRSWREL